MEAPRLEARRIHGIGEIGHQLTRVRWWQVPARCFQQRVGALYHPANRSADFLAPRRAGVMTGSAATAMIAEVVGQIVMGIATVGDAECAG
jgi:hypothetical protein